MTTGRIERNPARTGERRAVAERTPVPVEVEPARSATWPSRVALGVHVASLVGGFLVLRYCNRDQWFFGDEWEFLGHRGLLHADRSIWAPHTEHWSTFPILIYRALYNLVGIRTYVPYVVVLVLLHLAAAHFLWRVMRAVGASLPVATGLAAVYALLGAGYENLLWAFQIGFIGSVALGLAGILLVNHDGPWGRRDVAGWAVSIAGLMFSGVSVTMVTVAGLTVLFRRGWRDAALTVVVPGAVFLTWLALIGHEGLGTHPHHLDDVFAYPDYIWTGLRTAVEQATGFPGAGPLVVLGLAAWLLRRGGVASGRAAPAFACALGAIVVYSVIAVGRTSLGVQQSEASRYTYIAVALLLPGVALALSELADGVAARHGVIGFLLLLVVLHNGGVLQAESRKEKDVEQDLKTRILAAAELVSSPAQILNLHPEPEYSPDIVVEDLRRMAREGKLPGAVRITDADRLRAASVLQYAASTIQPSTASLPPVVNGVVGATEVRRPGGCLSLTPTAPNTELHLGGGAPFTVTVVTEATGELTGYLRTFGTGTLTGPPRVDKIQAGFPLYVTVTAAVDQVVLRLPPSGTTQVCGVR